ncbi:MAG: hypothetical protein PUC30_10235 [Lachnospiraceae bacterium]|nr:hypothetical protein [Lachnospiraceae bacterium]
MKKIKSLILGLTVVVCFYGCRAGKSEQPEVSSVSEETPGNALVFEDTRVSSEEGKKYLGTWKDVYGGHARMTITSDDGELFQIEINWSENPEKNTHWFFTGKWDEELGGISYRGGKSEQYFLDNGEIEEEIIYSDGAGLLWFDEDNLMHWANDVELQGNDCAFINVNAQKSGEQFVVEPLPAIFTELSATIPDGIYPVSFTADDLIERDGKYELWVIFFNYDYYDVSDVYALTNGSVIRVRGEETVVENLEWWESEGRVDINGGYEQNGISLLAEDNGYFYRTYVENDFPDYYSIGVTSIPVAREFTMEDRSDMLMSTEEQFNSTLPECIIEKKDDWTPFNTTIELRSGEIVQIIREWIPKMD